MNYIHLNQFHLKANRLSFVSWVTGSKAQKVPECTQYFYEKRALVGRVNFKASFLLGC